MTARAVLLDMDGTLVDSTAVVERIWTEWAVRNNLAVDEVLHVIHGRQGHASMAILLPERAIEVNLHENAGMLERETADVDGVIEIPGAAVLLAAIANAPHALVTSANVPLATVRMHAAGLELPTVRVTAEDVTHSKPDPEGFLAAAALLGVEPADCIVFEDSPAGIAAGRAAGMRVIGVGAASFALNPDWAVTDLTELTTLVTPEGVTFTRHV